MALMGVGTFTGGLAAHLVLTMAMAMTLTLALTGWGAIAKLLARSCVSWRNGKVASWWLLWRTSRCKCAHMHGLAKATSGATGSGRNGGRLKAAQR